MSEKTPSTKKKASLLAVSGIAVLAAGALGGAGLQALFTDTQTMDQLGQYSSGTIRIGNDFTKNSQANYTIKDNIVNLAAGDTTYRFFDVENTGSLAIGRLDAKLTTEGQLASTGKTAGEMATDKTFTGTLVNGEPAVGNGTTPMYVGITACIGGTWTATPVGTATKMPRPTCSGTEEAIAPVGSGADNAILKNTLNTEYPVGAAGSTATTLKNMASGADLLQGVPITIFNNRTQTSDKGRDTAADSKLGEAALPAIASAKKDIENGQKVNYMMTFHLPKEAKNEYQNTKATVKLQIDAIQRDSNEIEAVNATEAP